MSYGITPLHNACKKMSSEIVGLLVNDPRIDVNPRAIIISKIYIFFNRDEV